MTIKVEDIGWNYNETSFNYYHDMVRGQNPGTWMTVAGYKDGANRKLRVRQLEIGLNGNISSWGTAIDLSTLDQQNGGHAIDYLGNNSYVVIWVVSGSTALMVTTFEVDADGEYVGHSTAVIATGASFGYPDLVRLEGLVFAVLYNQDTNVNIATFSLSSDYKTITDIVDTQILAAGGINPSKILHHKDELYVVAVSNGVHTVTIPTDGSSVTLEDSDTGIQATSRVGLCKAVDPNIFAVVGEKGGAGYTDTFSVADDGAITLIDSVEHDNNGTLNDCIQLKDQQIMVNFKYTVIGNDCGTKVINLNADGTVASQGSRFNIYDYAYISRMYHLYTDPDTWKFYYILQGSTSNGQGGRIYTGYHVISANPDGVYVIMKDVYHLQDYVYSVRTDRGKDDELGVVATGLCELVCNNYDGYFSPQNVGSIFYPYLDLGAKIEVYEIYSGSLYRHFTGKIESIVPRARTDDATATITCYDRMDDLASTTIDTFKLEDTDESTAIDQILSAFGWESSLISLDGGVDTLEVWWVHDIAPLDAINKLIENSRGICYVDVDGVFIYENRHHRLTPTHLSSQYDFNQNVADIDYTLSKNNVINDVKVTGHLYAQSTEHKQPMWSAKTGDSRAPYIPPSGSLTVWAKMPAPIESIDSPYLQEGIDWQANSLYNGSGIDLTADVSLDTINIYGQAVEMVFSNANATTGAYLVHPDSPPGYAAAMTDQTLFIAGYLYDDFPFTIETENTTSQDKYGKRTIAVDATYKGNLGAIESYATWVVNSFKDAYPNPVAVTIVARQSSAIRTQCLTRKISDRITIASTRLGIDQDFYINRISQEYMLKEGGTVHITTYQLEATENLGGAPSGDRFWLIETVGYSELEETTWLGF